MISTPPFCRRSLLVGANGSAVDHLDIAIVRRGDGVHHPIPHASLSPSHKAIVAGGARAIALGRSRHGAPDRSTQKMPFSTRRSSTRGTPLGLFGSSGSITRHCSARPIQGCDVIHVAPCRPWFLVYRLRLLRRAGATGQESAFRDPTSAADWNGYCRDRPAG